MPCEELSQQLKEKSEGMSEKFSATMKLLNDDLEQKTKEIDPGIDTGGVDVWVGIDFDVQWRDHEVIFHLPQVTMMDQEIFLDLPQVTMGLQEIIFGTPSIRMETKQVGTYPEFYCDTSSFIPKCTTRWSPILIDVPVPFMEEHRIKLHLPEFTMATTSFIMGVPEFTLAETRMILKVPEFTIKEIKAEAEKAKARGEALKEEAQRRVEEVTANFREQNKVELGVEVANLFDCFRNELLKSRSIALSQIDAMITGFDSGIQTMVGYKVAADDKNLVSMQQSAEEARRKRDEISLSFDQKLSELDVKQREAVDQLVNIAGG